MSILSNCEITCSCGETFEAEIWKAVNVFDDPDLKEKGKKFVSESKVKVSELVEKGKAKYSKAFKKQAPVAEEAVVVEEKTEDLIQE